MERGHVMFDTNSGTFSLKVAKTLWFNIYRGVITGAAGEYVATVRIIPGLPLDRQDVPADAPEARPYLIVIVEDAAIALNELIHFESAVTDSLLQTLSRETFRPEFIQFFYPTPSNGEEEGEPPLS
jgi:hypothetical protein